MPAGQPSKEVSIDDLRDIDGACRTVALSCIKVGMRAEGLSEAQIGAEVHSAVQYLASCDSTKTEWREFTFLYRPNVSLSFDKLLDPLVPHMPAHIRHWYVQRA